MKYREITIHTASTGIEMVSNELIALGVGGFEIVDSQDFSEFLESTTPHWDYVDDELLKLKDAESVIRIYLPENAQGQSTFAMIASRMEQLKSSAYSHLYGSLEITEVGRDDSQWTDVWKKYYKPIVISSRLAVVPEWEEYTPTEGQAVLRMDPGAAFGTGSHETTALCLKYLSDMSLAGKSVLDVGCGSGILGIAALLLGAESNLGIDIDELAVKAGGENAARNGVAEKSEFVAGNLVDKVEGCYDVVCANIVADVIKMLLGDIGRFMKETSVLILSGIIEERTDEIIQAAAQHGFVLCDKQTERGWSALLVRKEAK
ncbi:MAG: 50S ribosomal protein L11 methyltransferase [Clostridia bacterium]|nr:50S ribosomal protein L11 methyltransferase [Clostridia bacterium]